MEPTYGWTDIEDIAIDLAETHTDVDPVHVRFTELRKLVEALPNFEADPDHTVNEQILEAIQAAWIEERDELRGDDDDEDGGFQPHNALRPD